MTETSPVYQTDAPADPVPDPTRPPAFVARLDTAALHAWVTAAARLLANLLAASHMPADWPREQAWFPGAELFGDFRPRIERLLACEVPPDPREAELAHVADEFNRLLSMLEAKDAECQRLRGQIAALAKERDGLQTRANDAARHAAAKRPAPALPAPQGKGGAGR